MKYIFQELNSSLFSQTKFFNRSFYPKICLLLAPNLPRKLPQAAPILQERALAQLFECMLFLCSSQPTNTGPIEILHEFPQPSKIKPVEDSHQDNFQVKHFITNTHRSPFAHIQSNKTLFLFHQTRKTKTLKLCVHPNKKKGNFLFYFYPLNTSIIPINLFIFSENLLTFPFPVSSNPLLITEKKQMKLNVIHTKIPKKQKNELFFSGIKCREEDCS